MFRRKRQHRAPPRANNENVLAVLACIASVSFQFSVQSGAGLSIQVAGVPIVQGSWFQYYAPGWTKGYYSSQFQTQQITKIDDDTVQSSFSASDGLASGTIRYRRSGETLTVTTRFEWAGDTPAKVETCAGMIWFPAIQAGTLAADSALPVSLANPPKVSAPEEGRHLTAAANRYTVRAPLASIGIEGTIPLVNIDGRGYDQDWASGKRLLWIGNSDIDVAKGKPAEFTVTWRVSLNEATTATTATKTLGLKASPLAAAIQPESSRPVLIPQPRNARLDWDRPLTLTGNYAFPAGRFRYFPAFLSALSRRFEVPVGKPKDPVVNADGGISKLGMAPGGYRITITPNAISVLGEEDEGLQNAMARLAQMAFVRNGQLCLPTGTVVDQPSTKFRGVHLFVGPEARAFHRKLWSRVLRPMGFNKVVLQCERTAWQSLPGTATAITMSRDDLRGLFADYRADNVEPIPLIQSLGHMEWFFANGQNRDLALNPDVPYTLDPRKPEAQAKIAAVWYEACALLNPKSLHFGLDEIDMRGFVKEDPALTTELWVKQLPFLGKIARKYDAKMMLWGDQALGPGEAPDAAFGDTTADARLRRAVIPSGATITDWHYKNDSRYQIYRPNLQLWKDAGFSVIAAPWYQPANVRGFAVAATMNDCGVLQTTWAGYASNEDALLTHPEQFTAMILAADYAWSGRQELPNQLGYDPATVFRRLYFGRPGPVSPRAGQGFSVGSGPEFDVAGVHFLGFAPVTLASPLSPAADRPREVTFPMAATARTLALALDTEVAVDNRTVVGEVTVKLSDGRVLRQPIRYGLDVRAEDDPAATFVTERERGLSLVRVELGDKPVRVVSVTLSNQSSFAGLRLRGLTTF